MKVINLVLNNFLNDSRVLKTSKTLSALGHDVEVVALHEAGLREKEQVGGVTVHRIPLATRKWPRNKLVQVVKFLEFIIRFVRNFRKADILHCNDLSGLCVGVCCKLASPKLVLVYDSHELAINDTPYQSLASMRFKKWLEGGLIRFAHVVITVSQSIAKEYALLYEIEKPMVVLNCPSFCEQPKLNLFRETLGIRPDQKIFLYQGALSRGRGIELLLEAFSDLASDKNVLVCMGYGPLEALIKKKSSQQGTIFAHPAVSPNVLLDYTSSADYGVSFIEDSCLSYRYCLPNKMFEYLMAGLPVLVSRLPEMARFVESERVGIVAEDNTVEGFRNAVKASLEQDYSTMQKNAFNARKKFCWEEQEKVLKEIYDAL